MNDALDIVLNGHDSELNGLSVTPNGKLNVAVNSGQVVDLKIQMDIQEPESDVRHEPMPPTPLKIDKLETASIRPEIGTPLDPASIAINPPNGTPPPRQGELLEDVRLSEQMFEDGSDVQMSESNGHETNGEMDTAEPNGPLLGPNNHHVEPSTSFKRSRETTPVASAPPSSSGALDNSQDIQQEDDGSVPPPAKRARTLTDKDHASHMHSATPPPASVANSTATSGTTPVPQTPTAVPVAPYYSPSAPGVATLSIPQFRFCQSTVRNLKKVKEANPFLRPVDPIALNIPHYLTIVKTPMDFGTIERKLNASNPTKSDPNANNPRYITADEFINDVRLIFSNCITFNGPDHAVTAMGKRVEEVFDKQIKNMPAPLEPVVVKKPATPTPPPPPPVQLKKQPRRSSTSVPVIRRSDTEIVSARPKREIHPPPPKDLPYADAPKKRKGRGVKDDGTNEQLKFCGKVLGELNRKSHWPIASPFYEPVDWQKLEIPNYPKVIKKPMDLATMRRKLDNGEYPTAKKFEDDFRLMIRNCFAFNPVGTPVNQAGFDLQRLFDEKWKGLPPLHEVSEDEDMSEDDEEEEFTQNADARLRAIAEMEAQIESMKGSIASLRNSKTEKKPKKEKKEKRAAPIASSSKVAKVQKASNGAGGKRKPKKQIADDDVLTFEQKKDLSEAIQKLDGTKLEKVIHIIHEGVPEIRDSTEEIELEIDLLPATVLTKLYNFVLRPLRAPATKRSRTGKGTGTGGLKRKSMDEDVEAEKIRQLEERMRLFDGTSGGAQPASVSAGGRAGRDDSDHSSDSSDASDSSGSDSE